MQIVGVCKVCGRTIEKEFVYCPWCGESQVVALADSFDSVLDSAFEKIEDLQTTNRTKRMKQIDTSLCSLEKELSELIPSSQILDKR